MKNDYQNIRISKREKGTIQGLAKLNGETTSDLIRRALNEHVAKSNVVLPDAAKEQVVIKAAPQVEEAIVKETAAAKSALDTALAGIPESLNLLMERLTLIEQAVEHGKRE